MFGKKKETTPRQLGRQVKRETNRGKRDIDREIRALDQQEKQIIAEIKASAKKNNDKATRILAKQLVQLRSTRDKMYGTRATVAAVGMQASSMAAQVGSMNAVGNAAKAMGAVNAQMDAAGTMKTMHDFQRQMEIMNVKEEMLDDALCDAFDGDEVEEEADGIVAQTLAEIGIDLDSSMAEAPSSAPVGQAAAAEETSNFTMEEFEASLPRLAS
mmetsp:Transcript_4288/g.5058  ORF Transcript_4288/g.5058 Transcript_4288/m.5058 type:complete len:214 (-) Transcript_4288:232-873(-)|eukprot:CAMPEP_0185769686 /NCGR_PEP_ID=MMETSP1174-20130828/55450_1 /TAXON_ID=35687 /ORGANISM="Dictyocha speculum, Strain CCMP1381" /LENGTH=213 /DNA_ID=CAMNT_0028454851 /DNA_START=131 /DNA_END=772 /DNA_ORIENTATION=+